MKRKEHKIIDGIEMKECSRCKVLFPLSEYRKDGSKWDGLYGYCKKCSKEKDKKVYDNDREGKHLKALEYQKRKGLTSKYKKYNPKYYSSDKSKTKKRNRDLKRRELMKLANNYNKITNEVISQIIKMYDGKCAYCGKDCLENYQIDHKIPLSKGGGNEIKNLALSCPSCNWSKGKKTDFEFCGRNV